MLSEWLARCPHWLCEASANAWAQLWPEDRMLQLALYCAFGLGALTVLVLLQVLLLGEVSRRRTVRRQQFNEQWRPFFALCSLSDELPPSHAPLPRRRQLWFLLQWNRTQLQLRGAARERMNRALIALGMDRQALILLRGRVRSKLIGLTCLRHLADPAHWQAVQPLLLSRNSIVALSAAQTLVAMDASKAMALILPAAVNRPDCALPRRRQLWFLLQWNRTQLQLRGAARERMNRALIALGMDRQALILLRGRVRSKLIGLTCLRHLADPAHWQAVQPLLLSRNSIVALSAAKTLVAMDASKAMQLILPAAVNRPDWALPRLTSLCQQAGEQAVTTPLLIVLSSSEDPRRERLVPLLVQGDPRHAAPWARARLDEGAPAEYLQVALRCLCELGDPRDRHRLLRALQHEQDTVRLAALQALHKQARREDSELFLPLLSDSSWWVRQAAADSLAAMPGATLEGLQHMLEQVRDRYGRDALRRAIAEVRR